MVSNARFHPRLKLLDFISVNNPSNAGFQPLLQTSKITIRFYF
jgi:hypothetical protein